jgi:hypothetical protein
MALRARRVWKGCLKLVGNGQRPEGPQLNRPGRQAGKRIVKEMSTEGAAQQRFIPA